MIARCVMLAIALGTELCAAASSTNSPAPARNSYEAFQIIAQRNIFDPNRAGGRARSDSGDASRAARSESITLVGTMLYDDVQFAFFDSSTPDYKKVLKPDEAIAGCKITEISPAGVKLDVNGKRIDLAVGQQLRRQDQGEWSVSGKPAADTSASTSADSSASSAEEDEVLKRLMKKREEENK